MMTDHDLAHIRSVFNSLPRTSSMRKWALQMVAEIRRQRRENRTAKVAGIKLAADVAGDYNHTSSHPYLISDCILGKLNVLKGQPRKNPMAKKINEALTRLEHKVESVEATTRFMAGLTKFTGKKAKKKK